MNKYDDQEPVDVWWKTAGGVLAAISIMAIIVGYMLIVWALLPA